MGIPFLYVGTLRVFRTCLGFAFGASLCFMIVFSKGKCIFFIFKFVNVVIKPFLCGNLTYNFVSAAG